MNLGLATVLAEGVRDHGADVVFGFPGGGPNLEVVGAVGDAGLRFVLAHGETTACIMAGTYGLLTGRPALAIATRGPGAASAVNGAAQATLDRFPLLVVTDCVSSADRDRYAHQRIDQQQMLGAVTKWSGRLSASPDADEAVRAALRLAAARPAGAVHLDYDPHRPADGRSSALAAVTVVGRGGGSRRSNGWRRRSASGDRRSRGTVVYPSVLAALEQLGCPVLTTYQAAGVIPEGHPQLAGLYTSGAVEASILGDCDLVLAIGLDQVEPMPSPWRYDVPVVSVSEVAACSTLVPIEVEVVGRLSVMLDRVTATATCRWPDGSGAAALAARARRAGGHQHRWLRPTGTCCRCSGSYSAQATATVDAGAHFLAVMPFWPATAPLRLLISNGLATMGFALPAAIAAALARPGLPVVCMVGDGGLAMTLAELETLARLQLPVTVVVFDDAALSLIEVKQKPGQGGAAPSASTRRLRAGCSRPWAWTRWWCRPRQKLPQPCGWLGSPSSDRRSNRPVDLRPADRRHPRLILVLPPNRCWMGGYARRAGRGAYTRRGEHELMGVGR